MRRGPVLAAVAGTGAAAALAVVFGGEPALVAAFDGDPAPTPSSATLSYAEVTRGDLADTETVDGMLAYADERVLRAGPPGTLTAIRGKGTSVRRGQTLYTVNRRPVTLFYGKIPLYRELSVGVSGADVAQLERNLKALGHGAGLTVDDHFTAVTAAAVARWQAGRNLPVTGAVDAAQVAVLPGTAWVKQAEAQVGDPVSAGDELLVVRSTRRVVTIDLDLADQHLARKGADVEMELPDGTRLKGEISKVGVVAEVSEDSVTVDVEVTPHGGTGDLREVPVTVDLRSETREDVLSVPVEALLALREGGYGVRTPQGDVIAVKPGLFAGGRVEVTGAGLSEGMMVEVPAS
ncbi:peptidoglycan-binding protein [Nonomuraea sp. SYSU D8015]|uniref:peptidoglycan-binding protein n=1 Tax=Nonomuraea sp. SYSU D8015 TaxID=2593644 RepID=UPI001CB6D4DE|nr:peptidoglycan-binding protein [Nonomuraea sp. SYSU D8015]